MDKRLLDYDPDTTTTQWHYYDADSDKTTIETVQDLSPYLERAKELRKDTSYSKKGIKQEFWHYASIPNAIIDKLSKEYGLDVFNKAQAKDVLKVINRDFPALKVTDGHHA